jgi:ribosomal protein S18 acetylase RimI-like enzyme
MTAPLDPNSLTIRPATPADAAGIVRAYLDSAAHHAALDPARYAVPDRGAIVARYQEGKQHPADVQAITLVALVDDEIAGFVDAKLDRSSDAMHRDMLFCHIVEIAVGAGSRSRGIGERLLRAAEGWGRENGATFASLEYHVNNARAAEFYQRQDYRAAAVTALKAL